MKKVQKYLNLFDLELLEKRKKKNVIEFSKNLFIKPISHLQSTEYFL